MGVCFDTRIILHAITMALHEKLKNKQTQIIKIQKTQQKVKV